MESAGLPVYQFTSWGKYKRRYKARGARYKDGFKLQVASYELRNKMQNTKKDAY